MLASALLLPADFTDNTDYWHLRSCCRRIMRIELIIGIRVLAAGGFSEIFGCHTSNS